VTSVSRGRAELRQSAANLLQLPILIAVAVIAMVIRQLFVHPPSIIVLGVCAELAALDIVLAVYLLRNMGSALVVTADDITFTRRPRRGQGPPPAQVIRRAAGSTLSFRMAGNGPVGSEYTGYALKLRDTATGQEVYAGAFGRRKVGPAGLRVARMVVLLTRPKPPGSARHPSHAHRIIKGMASSRRHLRAQPGARYGPAGTCAASSGRSARI